MSTYTQKHKDYYEQNKAYILFLRKERETKWLATPRGKYSVQKRKAKQRKIGWDFSFETWWILWEPYWENRGDSSGKYCMCRKEDLGSYSPENTYIGFFEENTKEVYLRNGINNKGQFKHV